MQPWNPAALLQPGRRAQSNTGRGTESPIQISSRPSTPVGRTDLEANNAVTFQFATSNDSASDAPPSGASTPASSNTPMGNGFAGNGVGNWIERMNNVQQRSAVPQAKRRRVDDVNGDQNGASVPVRHGGSGGLGEYVRDKQKEANGALATQAMMVDLTAGVYYPLEAAVALLANILLRYRRRSARNR